MKPAIIKERLIDCKRLCSAYSKWSKRDRNHFLEHCQLVWRPQTWYKFFLCLKAFDREHLDCPLSKGNQAGTPKIEKPNKKNTKSKNYLKSVKNWCVQLTWKLNEAISSKIWIESKQIKTNENQWRFLSFYI